MKIKRHLFLQGVLLNFSFASLFASCISCQENSDNLDQPENNPTAETTARQLVIEDNITYQTIDNFGASDAWSTQFVGRWPEAKKNAMADLLFSKEHDEQGNPKGIGLSLWRYNLGAGSAAQGSFSGISDPWRRGESFIVPETGKYDWNKMTGQVWFANAAKTRNVEKLLVFTNSPPVTLTRNNKAFTSDPNLSNLAPENYDDFATYLADVIEGMAEKGLEVDYISPVNEPQWDWTGGQEGTPFWNNEIAGIVKKLNQELNQRNLTTSIDISEAGQINYLYEEGNKPGRSKQINDFFNSSSDNYIGDLQLVGNAITGHSYFTTSPYSAMVSSRQKLNSEIESIPGLKYWMSEYCILGDNAGEIEGNGRDLGINPALYIARVIHSDLTFSNASAWHWWLAISPYDYKDGLIYVDKNEEDGNFYESKMLWALGNFSRFIRPGFQRIDISSSNSNKDFLFSAYQNPETGEKVVVVINSKHEDLPIKLEDQAEDFTDLKGYVTSATKDLQETDIMQEGSINIPKRSITTLIYK